MVASCAPSLSFSSSYWVMEFLVYGPVCMCSHKTDPVGCAWPESVPVYPNWNHSPQRYQSFASCAWPIVEIEGPTWGTSYFLFLQKGVSQPNKDNDRLIRCSYLLEIFQQLWEFSSPTGQQRSFFVWQSFPIKSIEPWVLNHLLESVFKFCPVLWRSNSRFWPRQQAGQEINTLRW